MPLLPPPLSKPWTHHKCIKNVPFLLFSLHRTGNPNDLKWSSSSLFLTSGNSSTAFFTQTFCNPKSHFYRFYEMIWYLMHQLLSVYLHVAISVYFHTGFIIKAYINPKKKVIYWSYQSFNGMSAFVFYFCFFLYFHIWPVTYFWSLWGSSIYRGAMAAALSIWVGGPLADFDGLD